MAPLPHRCPGARPPARRHRRRGTLRLGIGMPAESGRGQRSLALTGALGGMIGTALALDGATGLGSLLVVAQDAVPYLLIATALAVLVRVLSPSALVAFPVLLIALSFVLLAERHDWWGVLDPPSLWLTLATAGVVTATFAVPLRDDLSGHAVRRRAICWPRTYRCRDIAPAYIHLTATPAHAVVDLVPATEAYGQVVEVFVRRWGGRVELQVPNRWLVLVGRMKPVSTGLVPIGAVDDTKVYTDPAGKDRAAIKELLEKAGRAAEDSGNTVSPPRVAVVVHVLGIGGSVSTTKGRAVG